MQIIFIISKLPSLSQLRLLYENKKLTMTCYFASSLSLRGLARVNTLATHTRARRKNTQVWEMNCETIGSRGTWPALARLEFFYDLAWIYTSCK